MVEQVTGHKLYHVTVTSPHKRAFVVGEAVQIGHSYNPFFSFYERSLQFPITNNGAIVHVKAVAWLRQVRDKMISASPDTLAQIGTQVAMHYVMLVRELIMEEIRVMEFPEAPSRQKCLYACGTIDEARYWNNRIGDNGIICELTCSGSIHRADARLLLGDSEPLSVTRDRARAYWRGETSESPELEILFTGDASITGFGL